MTSIILGVGTWGVLALLEENKIPPQLVGLLMSMIGMVFGSLIYRYLTKSKL